jgi:hypothetical protein
MDGRSVESEGEEGGDLIFIKTEGFASRDDDVSMEKMIGGHGGGGGCGGRERR